MNLNLDFLPLWSFLFNTNTRQITNTVDEKQVDDDEVVHISH